MLSKTDIQDNCSIILELNMQIASMDKSPQQNYNVFN